MVGNGCSAAMDGIVLEMKEAVEVWMLLLANECSMPVCIEEDGG